MNVTICLLKGPSSCMLWELGILQLVLCVKRDRMLLATIPACSQVDPLEQCSHVAQGLGSLHLPSGGAWLTVKAMETIRRSQIWVLWNFILDALHTCSLHSLYPAPQ